VAAEAEGVMDIDLDSVALLGQSMAQGLWSEQEEAISLVPEEENEEADDPHLLQEDTPYNNPPEEGQEALTTDAVIDLPVVPLDLGSEE
jgi:hypothetical protein